MGAAPTRLLTCSSPLWQLRVPRKLPDLPDHDAFTSNPPERIVIHFRN
jgi:hypothetical protein